MIALQTLVKSYWLQLCWSTVALTAFNVLAILVDTGQHLALHLCDVAAMKADFG